MSIENETETNAEFDALVKAENTKVVLNKTQAAKRLRQMAFLKAFGECGTIDTACKAAHITRPTELTWRTNDRWYIERFQEAVQKHRDVYQDFVREWAMNGIPTPIKVKKTVEVGRDIDGNPIFGSTEVVEYATRFSENITMFFGKRVDPAWRDNFKQQEEEKTTEVVSPLSRIVIEIEDRASRKVINITPERKALPENTESTIIDATIERIT